MHEYPNDPGGGKNPIQSSHPSLPSRRMKIIIPTRIPSQGLLSPLLKFIHTLHISPNPTRSHRPPTTPKPPYPSHHIELTNLSLPKQIPPQTLRQLRRKHLSSRSPR